MPWADDLWKAANAAVGINHECRVLDDFEVRRTHRMNHSSAEDEKSIHVDGQWNNAAGKKSKRGMVGTWNNIGLEWLQSSRSDPRGSEIGGFSWDEWV